MAEPAKTSHVVHDEIVAQEKGVGDAREIDQGNEAVLLDIGAAGKSGANLKLAKDGHVRGSPIPSTPPSLPRRR